LAASPSIGEPFVPVGEFVLARATKYDGDTDWTSDTRAGLDYPAFYVFR
jgi:hypothetical protein